MKRGRGQKKRGRRTVNNRMGQAEGKGMGELGKRREAVMASFEDKLSIVATLAIFILKEDRSPERLETFLIPPGTDFDDDFSMDDGYAE